MYGKIITLVAIVLVTAFCLLLSNSCDRQAKATRDYSKLQAEYLVARDTISQLGKERDNAQAAVAELTRNRQSFIDNVNKIIGSNTTAYQQVRGIIVALEENTRRLEESAGF